MEVCEIMVLGRPFDPRTMRAVDIVRDERHADGEVLEVLRVGYEWEGEVFRVADVRVNRWPGDA
jgi:molecular chaperone GrpE